MVQSLKLFSKFQNIFGNGILAFLNSKTFTRILDREISRFLGITDRRCRSLDSIAKLDDRKENFWRGYRSQIQRNLMIAKIFGEVVDCAQQICVADEQKNLFVPRCNNSKMSMAWCAKVAPRLSADSDLSRFAQKNKMIDF